MAVMADEKWVQNARQLLQRRIKYTLEDAVWVGLVRMLNQEVHVPLGRAAELADEALALERDSADVVAGRTDRTSTGVVIDMVRFRSSHGVAVSAALTIGDARRRGRRRAPGKRKAQAIEKAVAYGVDLDLLREGLKLSPAQRLERLDASAAFVQSIRRARP